MYASRLFALGVLLGTLALAACGGSNSATTVRGSGTVKSETRDVQGFSQIALSGMGTVIVRQGSAEGLRIEAEDNLLPLISTTVSDDRLSIGVRDSNVSLHPTRPISYYITARQVSALHLSGTGEIRAPNLQTAALEVRIDGAGSVTTDGLRADTLTVGISGTGDYTGAGTAGTQYVSITGAGNYFTKQLQSTQATISIAGTGSATVRVSESLNVEIKGIGTILYVGTPQVRQQISGIGAVTQTA
ncbi:MAG TPA: head GIN domain-containing protein [Chloroflexota bacterium]|nr:head GIN domain-containing protein [Chloroflexota bacterium]